jgi:scyllo-inositol 2-dehydrogenase (NADP+)
MEEKLTIRIALVGLGKMGLSHLAILRTHPELDVVAVCDTFRMLLQNLNKHTGMKTYTDFEEMLQKERLDAVLIATPSRSHGPMVKQALDKNLHVFCEKPFCLDIEEGRALAALAKKKRVINQVGYHYRFLGTFMEAKRLLTSSLIGKIHHIRAEAYGRVVLRPSGVTWRSSRPEGGGCLYDYACHAIDLINFLHATPDGVEGTILNKVFSSDVDDEVYATFRFPCGATGQLAANWSDESFRKMSMQITIWGTNGRMRIDRQEIQIYLKESQASFPKLQRGWNLHYTTELTEPVWFYLRGEEYSIQLDHFARCINDLDVGQVSSFETALETDIVLSKMLKNANRVPASDIRISSSSSRSDVAFSKRVSTSVKSLFASHNPSE